MLILIEINVIFSSSAKKPWLVLAFVGWPGQEVHHLVSSGLQGKGCLRFKQKVQRQTFLNITGLCNSVSFVDIFSNRKDDSSN